MELTVREGWGGEACLMRTKTRCRRSHRAKSHTAGGQIWWWRSRSGSTSSFLLYSIIISLRHNHARQKKKLFFLFPRAIWTANQEGQQWTRYHDSPAFTTGLIIVIIPPLNQINIEEGEEGVELWWCCRCCCHMFFFLSSLEILQFCYSIRWCWLFTSCVIAAAASSSVGGKSCSKEVCCSVVLLREDEIMVDNAIMIWVGKTKMQQRVLSLYTYRWLGWVGCNCGNDRCSGSKQTKYCCMHGQVRPPWLRSSSPSFHLCHNADGVED